MKGIYFNNGKETFYEKKDESFKNPNIYQDLDNNGDNFEKKYENFNTQCCRIPSDSCCGVANFLKLNLS